MPAEEKWFPGLLRKCLLFADFQSLVACEQVNRDWHQASQERTLWETLYCSRWRCTDARLPSNISVLQIKRMHWTRSHADVRVNIDQVNSVTEQPNGTVLYYNELDNESLQCEETVSVRTSHHLQPMLMPPATQRKGTINDGESVHYFEALIHGDGSIGIVAVHEDGRQVFQRYGSRSDAQLGWNHIYYEYHSDSEQLYSIVGRRGQGQIQDYGPPWDTVLAAESTRTPQDGGVVIGCGYEAANGRLFFTRNGYFLGYAPVQVNTRVSYAASVSLHTYMSSVMFNLGRAPFVFDIEAFIANLLPASQDSQVV